LKEFMKNLFKFMNITYDSYKFFQLIFINLLK